MSLSSYEAVDVAIAGFGPTGQALAALLGGAGHTVTVVERHHELYPLPRAVHFDGEAMRLFDRLGITDAIADETFAALSGTMFGADGEPVIETDMSGPSPTGWARDYGFYQPDLEGALTEKIAGLDSVSVLRGMTATGVEQRDDAVELTIRPHDGGEERVVRARYLVGADGANSAVRDAVGITVTRRPFSCHWVVADIRPHDLADLADQRVIGHLDPARPWVSVPTGRSHRRWEFMLLPGERPEDFAGSESVWALLAPHITPDRGTLVRHAVFEFAAATADAMKAGRVLLVGDAAHLMPPLGAQGLCSGLRDVSCLAWKLDLVLRDVCGAELLDTYDSERRAQNSYAVDMSLMNSHAVCITDPEMAAGRDAALRSGNIEIELVVPGIGDGVVHREGAPSEQVAGHLAVQGTIERDGVEGLFDRVLGPGFSLVCRSGDPTAALGEERLAFLETIGARIATLDGESPYAVRDVDGALTAWLDEHGIAAAISRPDFYAYGAVGSLDELGELVDRLRAQVAFQPSREIA